MDSCIALQSRVTRLFFPYNFSLGILFHRGRAVFGVIVILRARRRFASERKSAESRRKISHRKNATLVIVSRCAKRAFLVSLMNVLVYVRDIEYEQARTGYSLVAELQCANRARRLGLDKVFRIFEKSCKIQARWRICEHTSDVGIFFWNIKKHRSISGSP